MIADGYRSIWHEHDLPDGSWQEGDKGGLCT